MLAINPERPEQGFLTTSGQGIYRSDDEAASWTQVFPSTEHATCLALVPQPSAATQRVYACLSGVTMSEDGGATWTSLNAGLPALTIFQLVHDPDTGRLYASTGRGIFVLAPDADEWHALDPDCESLTRGMALMKEGGQKYLVVGAEHGVRRLAL